MDNALILDCTLRDGGYINQWKFGKKEIAGIINNLESAGIDIIECGFLRDVEYDEDCSVFSDIAQLRPLIGDEKQGTMYVAMLEYGKLSPDRISPRTEDGIDGIRLTFHKNDWEGAKQVCLELMGKGYDVFVQPVGTTAYSDSELLGLISDVNRICPFALYFVDTLGVMFRNDVLRIFYLLDHNLNSRIRIGFHSHNNLQLSFSNAQDLVQINNGRTIIIDCSVYGMGRGAGNLATELFAQYINENIGERYSVIPLLSVAEQNLLSIYTKQRWGYDLPYYISATAGCHPNFAAYLISKQTLNIQNIYKILNLIPMEQRDLFNEELISQLYYRFQNCEIDDSDTLERLRGYFSGKTVLLLAPGETLVSHRNEICSFAENGVVRVAVNFIPDWTPVDFVFISNQKRLDILNWQEGSQRYIMTSNLINYTDPSGLSGRNILTINYSDYLGEGAELDNAGSILIRLLRRTGAAELALAGFDGYDVESSRNYCMDSYKRTMEFDEVLRKNSGIASQMKSALGGCRYRFITPTRYKLND